MKVTQSSLIHLATLVALLRTCDLDSDLAAALDKLEVVLERRAIRT